MRIRPVCVALVVALSASCSALAQERSKYEGITVESGVTHDSKFADQVNGVRLEGRRTLQSAMNSVTTASVALSASLHNIMDAANAAARYPNIKDTPEAAAMSSAATAAITNANSVSTGSDLSMIAIQSLISWRQNTVQLTTQMVAALNDAAKSVINNIGGGGGSNINGTPCSNPPCPSRPSGSASDAATAERLAGQLANTTQALARAQADLRTAALAQILLERSTASHVLDSVLAASSKTGRTGGSAADMSDDGLRNALSPLNDAELSYLAVMAQSEAPDDLVSRLRSLNTSERKSDLHQAFVNMMTVHGMLFAEVVAADVALQNAVSRSWEYASLQPALVRIPELAPLLQVLQKKLADLKKLEFVILQQIRALAAQIAGVEYAIAMADAACKAELAQLELALAAAKTVGLEELAGAGAVAGSAFGPVGIVVGAAVGAAASTVASDNIKIDLKDCELLARLEQQLIDLLSKMGPLKQALAQVDQQIKTVLQQEAAEIARLRALQEQNSRLTGAAQTPGGTDARSGTSAATIVLSKPNNPTSPCGGARNPCSQKPSSVIAPGLLEGDSGLTQHGPAATGAPIRSNAGRSQ